MFFGQIKVKGIQFETVFLNLSIKVGIEDIIEYIDWFKGYFGRKII